jgi:hypothetical protein
MYGENRSAAVTISTTARLSLPPRESNKSNLNKIAANARTPRSPGALLVPAFRHERRECPALKPGTTAKLI